MKILLKTIILSIPNLSYLVTFLIFILIFFSIVVVFLFYSVKINLQKYIYFKKNNQIRE